MPKSKNRYDQKFSLQRILDAARQEATGTKTVSYVTTTAATGILFFLISALFTFVTPPDLRIFVWLSLSFIFAIIFSPIRYALEELIRQLFPEADYNSHQLIKKLNTISYSSLTLQALSQTFFQELESGLEITESAFIFIRPKGKAVIKANPRFKSILSLTPKQVDVIINHIGHVTTIIHKFPEKQVNQLLKDYHIKLVMPLTNNNDLVGIMLLGDKFNQQSYSTKDIKVLNAVSPKIGFAIRNAYSYEHINKKNADLINDLKTANEKLRAANRQLRHDDKLKDEFVYVATHELKNPVTAMKGYLSLIEENAYGKPSPELKKAIDQIKGSNQQLINLLNNLLQIARAEAQTLEIKTAPTTICEFIDSVIKDLKPLADQKKLTLDHSCPNPAVKVMADPDRLHEIINNLVSNAIKYSDKGTVKITHEIIHDKLHTHIKDEGVGISSKDQQKIFTRFFRVEEEAAKGIPGSGLGLFICKQLIEKMGGKISFTSKIGKGSTFSIALPLAHTPSIKP